MAGDLVTQRSRSLLAGAAALTLAACPQGSVDDGGTTAVTTTAASTDASTSTSTSTSTAPPTTTVDTSTGPAATTGPEDTLPPAPTLVSPADGATGVPLATSLCWNQVDDPDGEPVRYRVYLDDGQVTDGILGDEIGYEGPCVGPLIFAYERSYTWRVETFELDDPTRTSPPSPTWSFTTMSDGLSELVFADDFDDDLGWDVGGDAGSGAWIRGTPVPAYTGELLTQPGHCLAGTGCWFTGQNPDGISNKQDVAGGATILTSPAFDLGGAAAATVQLGRFFYKSAADPGPSLAVELLVPKDGQPDAYDAYPLELLDMPHAMAADNLWLPREYAVCDAPLVDGSRLRISATDDGSGVLEAAIDSVKVRAHDEASVCGVGEKAACDPAAGPAACPEDLLCCSQGVINEGIYRCSAPVNGLDFASPPPTAADPGNGAPGCDAPDLIVDTKWIEPIFHTIQVNVDTCELFEGCVGAIGDRTLMLFTAATPNIGSTDLVMGVPANHPDLFHYSDCHEHYHFDEFARYELRDGDTVAAVGHKQAFCMLDTISWAWPNDFPKFDCANQGISRGFSDFYDAGLPCQWIDITDVPSGDYTLRITLNQPRPDSALPVLNERDYDNNLVEVGVSIP